MSKKFFIEITDPETNETHVSEFNQGKIFNSIEACQSFLDDNFIFDKDNFVINHWEIDQVSNNKAVNKKSYFDTNKRQAIKLQEGVDLYFPLNDQNFNWIIHIGSGPNIPTDLENRYIFFSSTKMLADWTDMTVQSFRPEAVLRLYSVRGKYSDTKGLHHNDAIYDAVWKNPKIFIEHRFFTEGKKGIKMFETKPNPYLDWLVKSVLVWKELKTMCKINGESSRDCVKNIIIPAAINGRPVKFIRKYAFGGCANLESVVIPDSVTSIGEYAFSDCTGLMNIKISNSLTSIEEETFSNCTRLTNIVIPDSVTSIGNEAFFGCTNIRNVNIPYSIVSIGLGAFKDCTGLASVNIPNSVTYIENFAFRGCTGLANINIPNSIKSIGDWAFDNCTGLTSIIIPDSVDRIGNWAFKNCTNLTNIVIPDSVTFIGSSAFEGCTRLTSVIFPDSITFIGWGAFKNCTGLTSIVIPDSIDYIKEDAFFGCANLKKVVVKSTNPPSIDENVFNNNAPDRKIFVPKEFLENYKKKWVDYKDNIVPIE